VDAARPADELLLCTVRGCGLALVRDGRRFVCAGRHAFDLAREGYLNLLQPTDRRSLDAGDAAESIDARARLHTGGRLAHLVAPLVASVVRHTAPHEAVLDLGCGSGHVLAALAGAGRAVALGLDLSTHAARRAARVAPHARIAVANVDRGLPVASERVAAAISLCAPRPAAELARALVPSGLLLVAVPAPDDLLELRALATGEGRLEERAEAALVGLAPHFDLVERASARATQAFDAAGLADLAAASYRAARHAERERVAATRALDVTLSVDVLVLRRR
jgi:23S rRNA (guanine745-N1)-methyltransferase